MKQFFESENQKGSSGFRFFEFCPYCGSPLKSIQVGQTTYQRCDQCQFTPYYNPYPGVVVLIVKDGKVLLGKRVSMSFRPKSWCLPGGFMEFNENFLAAAHREVAEETGLRIEIQSIVNIVSNFLSNRLHTLVVVLLGSPVSGIEQPGDDIEELQWFPLEGPFPPLAFEADEYILGQVARGDYAGLPVDPRFSRY